MIETIAMAIAFPVAAIACFWVSRRQAAASRDAADDFRRFENDVVRRAISRSNHMRLCESVITLRAAGIFFAIFALVGLFKLVAILTKTT